jgi:hypothetical protein
MLPLNIHGEIWSIPYRISCLLKHYVCLWWEESHTPSLCGPSTRPWPQLPPYVHARPSKFGFPVVGVECHTLVLTSPPVNTPYGWVSVDINNHNHHQLESKL